jgi:hypothetical protein
MRPSNIPFVPVLSLLCLVGCGFSPGPAAGASSGIAAGSGTGAASGAAGVSGTGTGLVNGDPNNEFGGNSGAAGSMSCGSGNVPITPLPPDILIVQDKSLSMAQDASGANCTAVGCSKWSQVSAAIDAVVMATQTTVNWGLVFFGTNAMCGTSSTPVVPVGANSYTAIQNAFAAGQPQSYTPTAAAMNAAVTYMNTLTDMNPKYILLATDGLPNCGSAGTTADDSPAAEAAVTAAFNAGFKTFVVGIGNTMGDATLNVFADNGGEPQTGAATDFYSVQDTADLETALNKIVGMIASCTISLAGAPAGFSNVVISATDASTGKPVAIPPTDWSYDTNMTNIILNPTGPTCMALQNGTYTNFQFNYACPGATVCIDKNVDGSCGS